MKLLLRKLVAIGLVITGMILSRRYISIEIEDEIEDEKLTVDDPKLLTDCKCQQHSQILKNLFLNTSSISDIIHPIVSSHGVSTCSIGATVRGPEQYVVSYSVFGAFPSEYYDGILKLVEQVATLYPGWVMRLYHNLDIHEEHQKDWLCKLSCRNKHLDLCNVENLSGLGDISYSYGMIWRMAVSGDPLVKYYIVRDADSPILEREVAAVQQWLESKKCFHSMHDHPFHSVPMLGGMWGGCSWWQPHNVSRNIMLHLINNTKKFRQDQSSLTKYVWPLARKSIVIHDSYLCKFWSGSIPFPTQRINGTFVGMRTYRRRFKTDHINKPCPTHCRPSDHKDWERC